ncbi:MAG: F0F1 ATP synthase subunit B [candidate division Zixibacteria bacterium]|nr:F0F1 ATP synthase subunit B [candidate division Zixibacteria bacterium]
MNLVWQQVLTQIVGFLIVLWVLKRFAWKPILSLLEERRQKIKSEFEAAAQRKEEANQLLVSYEAKLAEIDAAARAKITEAVSEAQKIAAEIKEEARHEGRELVVRSQAEIAREIAKAKVQLKEDMVAISLTATEKIISQRLDEQGHRRLVDEYLTRIERV